MLQKKVLKQIPHTKEITAVLGDPQSPNLPNPAFIHSDVSNVRVRRLLHTTIFLNYSVLFAETSGNDEDAESGNGPSLPQSPHSVEGAICGPKSLDSDFEDSKHSVFEQK